MKKKNFKRLVTAALFVVMLLPCFSTVSMATEEEFNVTPSTTDYTVTLEDATDFFLYNKETIGSEVGTEYYMTYTVQSIEAENFFQHGVLGCTSASRLWPYETDSEGNGGIMKFTKGNILFKEGYTYFFKFTVTEDGYNYRAAWAKGAESAYIKFGMEYGEVKTGLAYFGVWSSDFKLNGKLIRVRCYDKQGNDLGVKASNGKGVTVGREQPFPKDTTVEHSYTLTISDVFNIAISNKRKPTSNKVYIEYTVESTNSLSWQNGIILGNSPLSQFPYLNGHMQYGVYERDLEKADDGPLLVQGADYLMIFEKKEEVLDITIQRTLKGETTYITFPNLYNTYDANGEYYSIWLGDGTEYLINAVLTNFKCYDSNKNNLGVQTNKKCGIVHYGELEDYAGCESIYYCKELDSLYALYEDQSLKYTKDGATSNGTYRVEEDIMTTNINSKKQNYDYMFLYFTDEQGHVYERLRTYKVTFDTGEGSKVEGQELNAENGYMVMRPTDPSYEGNEFQGWYTAEGEAYEFGNISTESITLYAKWVEIDYMTADQEVSSLLSGFLLYGGASFIVLASIVCGMFLVRRKRHHDSYETE